MRVVIVGFGSIGHRHLRNLRFIAPDADVTIWHQHTKPKDAKDLPSQADRVVYGLRDALDPRPDVALITSPASMHIETALSMAKQGIHLFIEKPISHTLSGVDELLQLCHDNSLTLTVGYNFRYYSPLQIMRQALMEERIGRVLTVRAEVGQHLTEWRPDSDYRLGASARRELGGGAVLELSHELDYVRWLVGEVKTVSGQVCHLSDLDIDVEDTAEIILRFENGAIGSIHLDMIQRPALRMCRVIGARGVLTWNGLDNSVRLSSNAIGEDIDLHPAGTIDRNEMYLTELRHFLNCVRGTDIPSVSGEDGRRVLEIALAVKQSSMEAREVRL